MTVVTEEQDKDNKEKKVIRRLWHKVYPVKGDNDLIPDIKNIMTRFYIKGICVDSQGGAYIVPEIKKLGKQLTEMVFRSEKDMKYDLFRVKLFRSEVKSYHDEYLIREMNSLTSDLKAPSGYTDDAIDSFIIASYHYLKEPEMLKFYTYWEDDGKVRNRGN
jgi:hypothetical protein